MPEHRDRRHDAVQEAKPCRPEGSLFGTFSGRRTSSPGLKPPHFGGAERNRWDPQYVPGCPDRMDAGQSEGGFDID